MKSTKTKLENLISENISDWKKNAEYRRENKNWLDISASIALKILNHLKATGISQKALAKAINVSPQQVNKIVKGNENLTLQTICTIELALGIKLIEIPEIESSETVHMELKILPKIRKKGILKKKQSI
eukprot:Anaeramoba_ignava/a110523_5.p1 GENE.a110523_5~~a110523_5.p1  ORF type:complete len:129 (+),score=16.87 a110523_5:31-417(+)